MRGSKEVAMRGHGLLDLGEGAEDVVLLRLKVLPMDERDISATYLNICDMVRCRVRVMKQSYI